MSVNAAWILLFFSGLVEVCWTTSIKLTEGFTRPLPAAACVALTLFNLWLISLVFRTLPMGIAYAVWVGIGAAGTLLAGHYLFGDQIKPAQIFFVCVIFAGIAGVKLG